jgi:hypothetical protein
LVFAGHGRGAIEQVEDNRSSRIKVESDCSMNSGMASINSHPLDIGKSTYENAKYFPKSRLRK